MQSAAVGSWLGHGRRPSGHACDCCPQPRRKPQGFIQGPGRALAGAGARGTKLGNDKQPTCLFVLQTLRPKLKGRGQSHWSGYHTLHCGRLHMEAPSSPQAQGRHRGMVQVKAGQVRWGEGRGEGGCAGAGDKQPTFVCLCYKQPTFFVCVTNNRPTVLWRCLGAGYRCSGALLRHATVIPSRTHRIPSELRS